MQTGRSDEPSRDVVVCADVLGSFGVTPDDVRAQRREYRSAVPPGQEERSLEAVLADVLADSRDRTATVRQLICRSDRGLTCSARYAQRALGRELEAVFESIGWSFAWTRTGPAENGRDRLALAATDPKGRERETTVTYPATPLADDDLPAVLRAVDERLLAGTDATIVLLSAGVDRWRAALVEESELEALRDRYGDRIAAFDRPLLPEHDLEAFVPDEADDGDGSDGGRIDPADATEADPWPAWALERANRRSERLESVGERSEPDSSANANAGADADSESGSTSASDAVASLIDEAEPEESKPASSAGRTDEGTPDATDAIDEGAPDADDTDAADSLERPSPASRSASSTSPPSSTDGFEIRGGSPTVSRVRDDDPSDGASPRDVADRILEEQRDRTTAGGTDDRGPREDDADTAADESDDGFGTLSGSTETTRVTNDSFGTGESFETETDRYRALGVALGAGGGVSVEGLLEDDEFLPELPAAGPAETRIEFDDEFDPAAVPEATAAAERSGFEWVDSGSLETTRLSDR